MDIDRFPQIDDPCDAPECGRVTAWRLERLTAAGFAPRHAVLIAANRSFDLHALLDLVDRGCPPRLAVRIVSPIDDVEDWR